MTETPLLMGWRAIADYVGYSDRGLRNHRGMLLDRGVIFYRRMRLGKRMVCAWPADLREWSKSHHVERFAGGSDERAIEIQSGSKV